jgi:hypothetical protein
VEPFIVHGLHFSLQTEILASEQIQLEWLEYCFICPHDVFGNHQRMENGMKCRTLGLFLAFLISMIINSIAFAGGDNWVSRLTHEEYQKLLTYRLPENYVKPPRNTSLDNRDFPERFDWREMYGVTAVKDQGQCGSCWAFAAIGVLESKVYLDTGVEPDFSEQQLVDCDSMSSGCNGGNYDSAWEYLKDPGACMEADYPYHAQNQQCEDTSHDPYVRVTSYEYLNDSVDSIKAALQDYGPVATVMGANNNFQMYTGGCLADDSNTGINHGVVIVGWDDTICEGGSWIVKNSWGDGWGDNGFFTIRRGDLHVGEYPAIAYYEEVPPVRFQLTDYTMIDGNNNRVEPEETISVEISLKNIGRQDSAVGTAVLACDNPGIVFSKNTVNLPSIPMKGTGTPSELFTFACDGNIAPATRLEFQLTLNTGTEPVTVTFYHYTGPLFVIYKTGFEGATDEGWYHKLERRKDDWERTITPIGGNPGYDPRSAHSGMHVWGNNLAAGGSYRNNAANYLESPIIDCSGYPTVWLSFWRWLTVETAEYDHARVLVNGTIVWENPDDAHTLDKEWVYCAYDITPIVQANPLIQIRFTLETDEGLTFGGWNIDDLSLFSGVDAQFRAQFPDPAEIIIATSRPVYRAGDEFVLTYRAYNYTDSMEIQEWVVLDVFGQYWFWPGWGSTPDHRERTLEGYQWSTETLMSFTWPAISGNAEDMRFWAGILDPETTQLIDFSVAEWGWTDAL